MDQIQVSDYIESEVMVRVEDQVYSQVWGQFQFFMISIKNLHEVLHLLLGLQYGQEQVLSYSLRQGYIQDQVQDYGQVLVLRLQLG